MSFAFDIIQHNVAQIYQGRVETPQLDDKGRMRTNKDGNPILDYSGNAANLKGYFIEKPSISISQTWNDDARRTLQLLSKGETFVRSILPTVEKLWKGVRKGTYKDDGGVVKVLRDAFGQQDVRRAVPAVSLEWGGAIPLTISIDLIFMNKDSSITADYLDPLMDLSSFSKTSLAGATMLGPKGFQGTGFGYIDLDSILKGERESLTSLLLKQNDKVVLQLQRILVVESVQISGSEQLYDTGATDNIPQYKWIKANVTFKTVVPLPGPASGMLNSLRQVMHPARETLKL